MNFRLLLVLSLVTLATASCASKAVTKDEPAVAAKGLERSTTEPLLDLQRDATETSQEREADSSSATEERDYLCRKTGDDRWLQIEPMEDKGCKLWYTRDTGKKAVAWSSTSRDHCRKAREKMISRLEETGFSCKPE